jgi:hypothetical protein
MFLMLSSKNISKEVELGGNELQSKENEERKTEMTVHFEEKRVRVTAQPSHAGKSHHQINQGSQIPNYLRLNTEPDKPRSSYFFSIH